MKKIQHAIDSNNNNTVTPTALHQAGKQNGSTTRHSTSSKATIVDNTGLLSTILHQATKHMCKEAAFRFDNTPALASPLASPLAGVPPYIRFAKDMEATGQG